VPDEVGIEVMVVATNAAGNDRSMIQRVRRGRHCTDLRFQASNVNDEAGDQVTYALDESAIHAHTARTETPIDGRGPSTRPARCQSPATMICRDIDRRFLERDH